MPNWCLNEVRISFDDEETRKEFEKAVEGTRKENVPTEPDEDPIVQETHCVFVFDKILPMSGSLDDEGFDWYNWRTCNWGTKWEPDIIHYDVDLDGTEIYMEMYTAWGPPEGIYNKLCADWEDKGVHINWFYREDGMQFAGWLPD